MREVDEFLLSNEEYMNVIRESHPEVCFARLNGEILMTNKSEKEGIADRVQVLYMNKSQKWMDIIKRFSNTCETGRCPDC